MQSVPVVAASLSFLDPETVKVLRGNRGTPFWTAVASKPTPLSTPPKGLLEAREAQPDFDITGCDTTGWVVQTKPLILPDGSIFLCCTGAPSDNGIQRDPPRMFEGTSRIQPKIRQIGFVEIWPEPWRAGACCAMSSR